MTYWKTQDHWQQFNPPYQNYMKNIQGWQENNSPYADARFFNL